MKLRAVLPLHDRGKGSSTGENRVPLGGSIRVPEKDISHRLRPQTMRLSERGNGIEHHCASASTPTSSDQMGHIGRSWYREWRGCRHGWPIRDWSSEIGGDGPTSPQNNIKNLSTQVRSVLLNQPGCYVTYMTSEWNPPVKSTLIHNSLEKYWIYEGKKVSKIFFFRFTTR